jgi:hypothetical protein
MNTLLFSTLISTLGALAGAGPYTADEAVDIALRASPLLESLAHRIDEEEGPRTLGLLFENPELRIATRHLERTVNPTSTVADVLDGSSVGVRVPVPPLTAMGFEQQAYARHVDATRSDLDDARRELAARVRVLHATVLNIDARLALVDEQMRLGQKTRELVEKRIEVGLSTRFDESIAALDLAAVITEHEALLAERRLLEAELRSLLALPASEPVVLVGDAKTPCDAVQEAHFAGAAPASTTPSTEDAPIDPLDVPVIAPTVASIEAQIAEEENMRLTRLVDLVPWVRFVELEYRLGNVRPDDSLRFQLGVPLPLVNFNQDDVRTHTAKIARLRAERAHELTLISGELRAHRENLAGQRALLSLYDEKTAPVIDQSLTLVDEALALGEGDPVQMTVVSARAIKAKTKALETRLRCDEAAIAWLARAGRDPALGDARERTGL